MRRHMRAQLLLAAAAAACALLAAPHAAAQAQAGASSSSAGAGPGGAAAVVGGGGGGGGNISVSNTSANVVSVDQAIPGFWGIRSCLPFNVLVAAPAARARQQLPLPAGAPGFAGTPPGPAPSAAAANASAAAAVNVSARIIATADAAVLNATVVTVEDGILTLSLAAGFDSQAPINFTIVPPASGELRYVANYGSGLLVLGPGHTTSRLRLLAPAIGQIHAINLTAATLNYNGSGVLGSSLSGAFQNVGVATSTATGTIALTSYTPVALQARLAGIATLIANVPQGSNISGTAGGLSKVQYTQGTCNVASDAPLLFPAPSIFGPRGFGFGGGGIFGSKCERVTLAALQPLLEQAQDPVWTCGVTVDGAISCSGPNDATATPITWNATNVTMAADEPRGGADTGAADNAQTATITAEPSATANIGSAAVVPQPNAAGNAQQGNVQQGSNTEAIGNAAGVNAGSSANTGSSSANTGSSANVATSGNAAAGGNAAGNTETIGNAATNTGGTAAIGDAAAGASEQGTTDAAGGTDANAPGGRKLLQQDATPSPLPAGGAATTNTTSPPGTLTTGAGTTGGGYAVGSGTVSGPGGSTTQTTSSQGGSAPQTSLSTAGGVGSSLFNPTFLPATPSSSFEGTADVAPGGNASVAGAPSNATSNATAVPAAAGAQAPVTAVSIQVFGPGRASGVAVANTLCRFQGSLSMLQRADGDAGSGGGGAASGGGGSAAVGA